MQTESATPSSIIKFWFSEPAKKYWFNSTKEFDQEIRDKFENIWEVAASNKLDHWKKTAEGCLALTIILDQFPLNMFRGIAKSFSTERKSIEISHFAVSNKLNAELPRSHLPFLYMPLMHSEDINDQNLCVRLFEDANTSNNLRFAKHHRDIILEFGRFPHRNKVLNRKSTKEELEYLASLRAFKG